MLKYNYVFLSVAEAKEKTSASEMVSPRVLRERETAQINPQIKINQNFKGVSHDIYSHPQSLRR